MDQLSKGEIIAHAAHMAEFKGSQAHDIWLQYLRRLEQGYSDSLVTGNTLPLDQLRYYQGITEGIRLARKVPENVILWGKAAQAGG